MHASNFHNPRHFFPHYYFDETAQSIVPQALTCVLESESFEDATRNAISIGDDSDTINNFDC